AAALARRCVHRLFERRELGLERRLDDVAQEDGLIDAPSARSEQPANRGGALLVRRTGIRAHETQCERRDRTAARRLSEIEYLSRVRLDAALSRSARDCLDQSGFADAGLAADDDRAPVTAGATAIERSEHHGELGPPADER